MPIKMGLGPAFASDSELRVLYARRKARVDAHIRMTEDMSNIDVEGDPTTAGAVIFDITGEKILLALDGYRFDEGKEMWVVPKGERLTYPDGSREAPHETAHREVVEEMNLDLDISEDTPYIQVFAHRLIRLYLTMYDSMSSPPFDEICLDRDETIVARWFRKSETDERFMNLPTKKVLTNINAIRDMIFLPRVPEDDGPIPSSTRWVPRMSPSYRGRGGRKYTQRYHTDDDEWISIIR